MDLTEQKPTEEQVAAMAREIARCEQRGEVEIKPGLSPEQEHQAILERIEEAANLLHDAAQLACDLPGWCDPWEDIGAVYDEVSKLSGRIRNGPLPGQRENP